MKLHLIDIRSVRKPVVRRQEMSRKLSQAFKTIPVPDGHIEITFMDDSMIQSYNRKYRRIDRPTNVLAFPQIEFTAPESPDIPMTLISEKKVPIHYGDVLVSVETVHTEADRLSIDFCSYLYRIITHGILHLFGYDHDTDSQYEIMETRLEELLDLMEISKVLKNGV